MLASSDFKHLFGSPSRRSWFLRNRSRRSSGLGAESHPQRCRLTVSVWSLSAGPLLHWIFWRAHLVHRHDRGNPAFSFHPLIVDVLLWPAISSRLFIILSSNHVTSYIKATLCIFAVCLRALSLFFYFGVGGVILITKYSYLYPVAKY